MAVKKAKKKTAAKKRTLEENVAHLTNSVAVLTKSVAALTDSVVYMRERMLTREDVEEIVEEKLEEKLEEKFDEKLQPLKDSVQAVESKIGGIHNRIDYELDKRGMLETRVTKLEKAVFGPGTASSRRLVRK